MMIFLYVLLAIILLFSLVLSTNISFVFTLKGDFDFKVRVGGISVNLEKIASKNKDSKLDSIKEKHPKVKKKLTPSDVIELVSYLLDVARGVLGEFARYAKIKLCFIKITVASDDAFETAKLYGTVCAFLYPALEFLNSFMNIKKNYKNVSVAPDFTKSSSEVEAKIIIKLKIIHVLLAGYTLLPVLAKGKKGK